MLWLGFQPAQGRESASSLRPQGRLNYSYGVCPIVWTCWTAFVSPPIMIIECILASLNKKTTMNKNYIKIIAGPLIVQPARTSCKTKVYSPDWLHSMILCFLFFISLPCKFLFFFCISLQHFVLCNILNTTYLSCVLFFGTCWWTPTDNMGGGGWLITSIVCSVINAAL